MTRPLSHQCKDTHVLSDAIYPWRSDMEIGLGELILAVDVLWQWIWILDMYSELEDWALRDLCYLSTEDINYSKIHDKNLKNIINTVLKTIRVAHTWMHGSTLLSRVDRKCCQVAPPNYDDCRHRWWHEYLGKQVSPLGVLLVSHQRTTWTPSSPVQQHDTWRHHSWQFYFNCQLKTHLCRTLL